MSSTAIILSGGMGSRLRPIVSELPKSLAPIKGIPFIFYLLEWLHKQQLITEVYISVGYMAGKIIDRVGSHYKSLKINYCVESEPLGTGGAIRNSLQEIKKYSHYLVLNGDTFASFSLPLFFKFHTESLADLSIASKLMRRFDRYGCLTLTADHSIIRFNEKKFAEEGYINCGAYVFSDGWAEKFLLLKPDKKFSFEKDILERSLGTFALKAYVSDFYFKDIGVPEDYETAQIEFPKITI